MPVPRTVRRGAREKYAAIIWQPYAITAVAVIVFAWGTAAGVRSLAACVRSAHEVVVKTREYKQTVADNRRAEAETIFLRTQAGKAYAARTDLGYIDKSEEHIELAVNEDDTTDRRLGQRFRDCLARFECRARAQACDAIDTARVMLGLWEPVVPGTGDASLDEVS